MSWFFCSYLTCSLSIEQTFSITIDGVFIFRNYQGHNAMHAMLMFNMKSLGCLLQWLYNVFEFTYLFWYCVTKVLVIILKNLIFRLHFDLKIFFHVYEMPKKFCPEFQSTHRYRNSKVGIYFKISSIGNIIT